MVSTLTLVLVHGWPVTEYHWRCLKPRLAAEGVQTIAWTPPGLGAPVAEGLQLDKRSLSVQLESAIDTLGLSNVVLVGHDWGATICWLLASRRHDLVAGLVIEEEIFPGISTQAVESESTYPDWHAPFLRARGLAESLVPGRESAFYRQFLTESAGPAGLAPETIRTYLGAYEHADRLLATVDYYRSRPQDLISVAEASGKRPDLPILAIGGRFGMGVTVTECAASVSTSVRSLHLDEAGHYPAEQEPDAVANEVLRFIRFLAPGHAR